MRTVDRKLLAAIVFVVIVGFCLVLVVYLSGGRPWVETGEHPEFLVTLTDNGENDFVDIKFVSKGTGFYSSDPLLIADFKIQCWPVEDNIKTFEIQLPHETLSLGESTRVFLDNDVVGAGKVYQTRLTNLPTGETISSSEVPAQPGLENMHLVFETDSHSDRHDNREYLVIENSDELERVWDPLESPPEINFSAYMVIAVFMGGQPSGGHSIKIEQITNMENEIVINIKEIYPGRTTTTTAYTFPNHIVKLGRIQKPAVFEVQQFMRHTFDENGINYDEVMYELVGEYRVEPGSAPPEP